MFLNQDKFGRTPKGARLERILASPHFRNGRFENLDNVAVMVASSEADDEDNASDSRIVNAYKVLFGNKDGRVPLDPIPNIKTDLLSLPPDKDIIIWMGHSSFYLQLAGKRILIDPVFSGYGSPVFFINKAFVGSDAYTPADIPPLDVLAITHDHWDHLDYATVMALKEKTERIVCPLGVGEYFEMWGFDTAKMHEEDWFAEISISDALKIHLLPSQHFSGRLFTQNPTLWCGMAFITPERKVYLSGDGGYGGHFPDIGKKFGGFDLAIMENGQYNKKWAKIHMLPEETAIAAADVRAKTVIPSHSGKFALALHKWKEPYEEFLKAASDKSYAVLTPKIGETVAIGSEQKFSRWWEDIS